MPMHPFHRTELLVGGAGWRRLTEASFCVVGLGGVGSYAAEALARAGAGHLTLVDFDDVCVTNVNRQLHAFRNTVGKPKAELMAERCSAINPKADVRGRVQFFGPTTAEQVLDRRYDYVLDCIDNMTAKVMLIERCVQADQPVIAALGAGGRLDPTRVRVTDISKTRVDPFARIVRDLLRQRGIERGVECVWTDEPPNPIDEVAQAEFHCICANRGEKELVHGCENRMQVQGTVSWMPAIFGLTMTGAVVNRVLGRPVHSADVAVEKKTAVMAGRLGKKARERIAAG